ncbi:MAG: PorP/SprF family type IX secretion system membrane protein [Chitinophagaceae bacterium]
MKRILTSILLSFLAFAGKAQDIHFSQFYENAILRNPALTGIFSGDYKVGVNYRTQWGNISNPFQTTIVSAESRILVNREQADYLSYGLCVSYDHAGDINFNSLTVTPAVNYNKSLNDAHASYLSAGFAVGYIQRSVDPSKMTLDNQYLYGFYDPNAPTGEKLTFQNIHHFDVSAGLSFNSTFGENSEVAYYIGAAAWHITRPRESFNGNENFIRLNPKFTGNIGIRIRLSPEFGFSLLGNYANQNPSEETIFGGLLSWRTTVANAPKPFMFSFGCFARLQDAIIPTIKIDYGLYAFTMSYDVTTSSLKPSLNSNGGYEFSVYIRGKLPKKDNNLDKVRCPQFEQNTNSGFYMED